jgi:hypothetical protein
MLLKITKFRNDPQGLFFSCIENDGVIGRYLRHLDEIERVAKPLAKTGFLQPDLINNPLCGMVDLQLADDL